MTIKLNIGAGDTRIEGWIPIDRKFGTEAYPLPASVEWEGETISLADNTVDEIRASHILEHFSFADAEKALRDWVRVLKPGGKIRIAVPDVDAVLRSDNRDLRLFWLMGGQTDENNFHKSAYDRQRLQLLMHGLGLINLRPWKSENTDSASLPISLNMEGEKSTRQEFVPLKIAAYMTLPRYEAVIARRVIEKALDPLKIPLNTSQGVFWGQCMQRMFEEAVEQGIDWILSIDSDSLFTSQHVDLLLQEFGNCEDATALAALQCRRGKPYPLMTAGHAEHVETDGNPILATSAHFGLTLIRVEDLVEIPKPWFKGEPEEGGTWGDDRLDDDIWFWHQLRRAGKRLYVTPRVSIGHLEETVAVFDEHLQPKHVYAQEWLEEHGLR